MKKNGFMEGAIIATMAIIISKLLGVLYVIPFNSIIGDQGGALYGYAYNIYNFFLIVSSAGIPLAISKITSEYIAKEEIEKKKIMFKISQNFIRIFSITSFLVLFILAKPIAHLVLGELSKGNTIEDVTFVIRCVSFALIIVPMLSIERGYLQGHKYITSPALSQVLEQVVRVVVIIVGSYLALNVFHWHLKVAVGISTLAAGIGALFSYIYLLFKTRKIKDKTVDLKKVDKETKRNVLKSLISYCIPFIVVNVANSLYNTTDMILMNRGLHALGFADLDVETISSVFTTWGNKLLSIVTAIATGLVISLIPSIVAAYVKKEKDNVNTYFNKALQVLLFIILPLTVFMSMYAPQIWSVFYKDNYYGPIIFRFTVIIAFFDSANITIFSALQGLYKTKLIYISEITGFIINLMLDIPLMFLFNKIGIYPYYGAITATLIGYLISHSIPLIYLHKKDNFSYHSTIVKLPRLIISIIVIIAVNLVYTHFLNPFGGRLGNIIYVGLSGLITVSLYYLLNIKIINELLIDKIKKVRK